MSKAINNGRSWKSEFLPGSKGERAIESLGLRPDHLRHDLVALDDTITSLEARVAELEADLEICMNALDRLADLTTMGPAIHANICEAGRNEIEIRIAYADEQRARTAAWQRARREADAEEAAACAANREVGE